MTAEVVSLGGKRRGPDPPPTACDSCQGCSFFVYADVDYKLTHVECVTCGQRYDVEEAGG